MAAHPGQGIPIPPSKEIGKSFKKESTIWHREWLRNRLKISVAVAKSING
jgi:hypothetical protein